MPSIITCAKCGKMESWSPGQGARTHCRFCHAPLTGSTIAATPKEHARHEKTSPLLKATLSGGAGGAALGLILTLIFNGMPIIIVALGLIQYGSLREEQRSAMFQAALAQLVMLTITAAIGFAVGSVLMSGANLLLAGQPRRMTLAGIGAFGGACLPPIGVLFGLTLPVALDGGPDNPALPAALMWHWILSLVLAAAGAVIGLVAMAALLGGEKQENHA